MDLLDAESLARASLRDHGLADVSTTQSVFTYENAKTVKGEDLGYLTAIRYLAPANESGTNVCPNAGACAAVCLYTAGRGAFAQVKDARIRKTEWRLRDRSGHLEAAALEVSAALKRASKRVDRLAAYCSRRRWQIESIDVECVP